MAELKLVKYVFMDIVSFTKDRPVEAQAYVVAKLNDAVSTALKDVSAKGREERLLLPTGDGMAIAIIDADAYDIHLSIALEVLKQIEVRNSKAPDESRKFSVRIGLNENVDNVILDINGRRNVAGSGIAMAQRIMDCGDGSQILLGETVYETVAPREKYINMFRSFTAKGKHGIRFPVHQYIAPAPRLDREVPTMFRTVERRIPKFTKLVAYYVAQAAKHEKDLLTRKNDRIRNTVGVILLFFRAQDCVRQSENPPHERCGLTTYKAEVNDFSEQYEYYKSADIWMLMSLRRLIEEHELEPFGEVFKRDALGANFAMVKPDGIAKLSSEWPEIAREFKINASKSN